MDMAYIPSSLGVLSQNAETPVVCICGGVSERNDLLHSDATGEEKFQC